jgi:hypothetical protein
MNPWTRQDVALPGQPNYPHCIFAAGGGGMANEEHLAILKQGVKEWNRWWGEEEGDETKPDLSYANLFGMDLVGVDFTLANLRSTNLRGSDLRIANLSRSDLSDAILTGGAKLIGANLTSAHLKGTNLTNAFMAYTVLGDNDLSEVIGLESIVYGGPSTIGVDTLYKSRGKIPDLFLRGCGLSDADIEYAKLATPGLSNEEINDITYRIYHLTATQAVQINPLFISYSHNDGPFVDEVEKHLNSKGIRFWRDVHHATAGRLEKQIDRAMRLNPTVLLILSEHSVNSDWVEHEAASARELEKELKRDVLCPIALDDTWKTCDWPKVLRRQFMDYNILDFSKWEDDDFFSRQFNKLIEGLHIFYQGEKPEK